MTDMQTRDIYINTALDQTPGDQYKTGTDLTNTTELIGVAGHENMHAAGERSEAVADRGMTQAQNAWESENRYNGNTTGGGYKNKEEFVAQNQDSLTTRWGTVQADQVDDVAALMIVQAHEVEPLGIKTGSYHASIKFKPENQHLYRGDDRFIADPDDNKLYTTLGAGPSLKGNKLKGDLKRKSDMRNDNKVLVTLPIVSFEQEDRVFQKLTELNEVYNQHQLEYDTFPDPNKTKGDGLSGRFNRAGDSFNSNSYVSGILNAAKIPVPPVNEAINIPGYVKPVPEWYFQKKR